MNAEKEAHAPGTSIGLGCLLGFREQAGPFGVGELLEHRLPILKTQLLEGAVSPKAPQLDAVRVLARQEITPLLRIEHRRCPVRPLRARIIRRGASWLPGLR